MTKLTPPAAIQRGRKDIQYIPGELNVQACAALVLHQVAKAGGTLEIKDWDKVEADLQQAVERNLKVVVWSPGQKDSLGDLQFTQGGQAVPVSGSRYLQIIEAESPIVQPQQQDVRRVQ